MAVVSRLRVSPAGSAVCALITCTISRDVSISGSVAMEILRSITVGSFSSSVPRALRSRPIRLE